MPSILNLFERSHHEGAFKLWIIWNFLIEINRQDNNQDIIIIIISIILL